MESFEENLISTYLENHKLPTILYHYTSINGLLGIVNSKSVWTTNIKYLNDNKEFNHTLHLLEEKAKQMFKGRSKDKMKKDLFELIKSSQILDDYDIYVFSLSENGDLLSQWRGYCPDYGFSIGFEYSKIIRLLEPDKLGDFLLLPCYYKDENKKDYIDSIIQSFFNSIITSIEQRIKNTSTSGIFTNAFKEYTEKAIKIGSIFKSDSFSEEAEWRLVYYERKETASLDIKFRNGNAMIIPYIEFPLENKYKTTPITKIIVGPSPNQDISIESVSRFLSSSNIRCEVKKSNIPFRKL